MTFQCSSVALYLFSAKYSFSMYSSKLLNWFFNVTWLLVRYTIIRICQIVQATRLLSMPFWMIESLGRELASSKSQWVPGLKIFPKSTPKIHNFAFYCIFTLQFLKAIGCPDTHGTHCYEVPASNIRREINVSALEIYSRVPNNRPVFIRRLGLIFVEKYFIFNTQ